MHALARDCLNSNHVTHWVTLTKILPSEEEIGEQELSVSKRYNQDIVWISHWYNHIEKIIIIQMTLENSILNEYP